MKYLIYDNLRLQLDDANIQLRNIVTIFKCNWEVLVEIIKEVCEEVVGQLGIEKFVNVIDHNKERIYCSLL